MQKLKECHETFERYGLSLLKHDQQTDGQPNVYIECTYHKNIYLKISAVYLP